MVAVVSARVDAVWEVYEGKAGAGMKGLYCRFADDESPYSEWTSWQSPMETGGGKVTSYEQIRKK